MITTMIMMIIVIMMMMMMMMMMIMTTIIMIIIMIIISTTTTTTIIAFKGAIRDFYNLLTAPQTVSNTYAQVVRAQSCANRMQHIERISRATCRVTCHGARRYNSAVKLDRV